MKKSLLLTLALTPILAIACSKPAVAGVTINPVEVTLGYEYNDVTEGQDGVDSLRAEIGTVSKVGRADVSYGLTTLTNDNSLRSYGAYAGLPLKVQGTKITVEPRIAVEQYRDESELVGSVGVGARYAIVPTVDLNARAMYSRAFDNDAKDLLDGESYMVGLTKRF
jgi:hypothetical protein